MMLMIRIVHVYPTLKPLLQGSKSYPAIHYHQNPPRPPIPQALFQSFVPFRIVNTFSPLKSSNSPVQHAIVHIVTHIRESHPLRCNWIGMVILMYKRAFGNEYVSDAMKIAPGK